MGNTLFTQLEEVTGPLGINMNHKQMTCCIVDEAVLDMEIAKHEPYFI